MSAVPSIARLSEMSPRLKARLAGAFYLVTILLGVFSQRVVSDALVRYGDAAATASNILAHESLYRLGYAVYLIELACQITMTALFYDLLKPVSRSASLLAAFFGLVGCTVKIVSRLFFLSPLLVLEGGASFSVFSAEQAHALALLLLKVNYQAETVAMVFFGLYASVKGYLVFRSTFLPRALGVLSAIGGFTWLAYLYEPFATRILPIILLAGLVGSLANIGWLLTLGVDDTRWREQASTARESIWR
ncbi:MAG: hypothetical protein MNPFHGCM_03278 [Gemmatimonadaceae bacterium]|nr:hypothetical protein [Gemmatimonadaceae bacterium]